MPYPTEIQNEQHERLQIIAQALELPEWEIDRALASEGRLIEFAERYDQSLDYIVRGDLQPMLRALCKRRTEGLEAF